MMRTPTPDLLLWFPLVLSLPKCSASRPELINQMYDHAMNMASDPRLPLAKGRQYFQRVQAGCGLRQAEL